MLMRSCIIWLVAIMQSNQEKNREWEGWMFVFDWVYSWEDCFYVNLRNTFFIMCACAILLIYWRASTLLPAELLRTISPSFPIVLGNISSLLWQMCRDCEHFRWIRLQEMVPYWRTYLTGSVVGWIPALQYHCRSRLWLGGRFPEPENV